MNKIRLIRIFENFNSVTPNGSGDAAEFNGEFTAHMNYLLSNGWRLISSGFEVNKNRHELSGVVFSWAYIENTAGAAGELALKSRGLTIASDDTSSQ